MKISPKLSRGILHRRYKRFLADITDETGQPLTVHCPNTGSMRHCIAPETPCWYSHSNNPKRKYPNTLEIVTTVDGHKAGINTGRANSLVAEAIDNGTIAELAGYQTLRTEAKCGVENSRMDFLLTNHHRDDRPCYVEVKNVTLLEADGRGYFPDAVSERGSKHLRALATLTQQGCRAVLLFCVQHSGITSASPADHIDPEYGRNLLRAVESGVEILAYQAQLTPSNIALHKPLPVILS